MLSPTDGQTVSSTTASLNFTGLHTQSNAPVQIQAWDYAANRMESLGSEVRSSASPSYHDSANAPLYSWSASRTLAARHWRGGPAGGSCAAVGATTTLSGTTYNLVSVERDWLSCSDENSTASGFASNCAADNSPVANVYTRDWGSIAVSSAHLGVASALASARIRIDLDNYTPTAYEFCSSSTPARCPPGGASDPETYKYYRPNGGVIRNGSDVLSFSIHPSRRDPMTIYIDDMSSRSIDFRVQASRFVLGINFENAGPEIRMNCIRNVICAVADHRTIEFATPRAELHFTLTTSGGRVGYSNVTTTFTTGTAGSEAADAGAAIASAISDKLQNDATIRNAISAALDSVIRGVTELADSDFAGFPIESVTLSGTSLSVRPGCPRD